VVVYAAAVLLLIVTGLSKLVRPDPTAAALAELTGWWPRALRRTAVMRLGARAVGVVELGVAALAIGVGGSVSAVAVLALYLCFSVVVVLQLRAGSAASCGCAGSDSPATGVHLLLTLGAAAGAASVGAADDLATGDALQLGLGALLAWLALMAMTTFADLTALVRTRSRA
jgi:hypothetical protein